METVHASYEFGVIRTLSTSPAGKARAALANQSPPPATDNGIPVYQAVADTLAGLGVKAAFGLLGSGNFHVTNALVGHQIPFYASRHETGAVTMADAYARVAGGMTVCTLHQGPGLTNAMTGLTEAVKAGTPMLVLAADTAGPAVHSNFRIDQKQLVLSVGAGAERLHAPASAVTDTLRAWHRAQTERRPVVLMMPLDVQQARIAPPEPPAPWPVSPPIRPAAQEMAAAVAMMAAARRPLIVAGRGAVAARGGPALERLADKLGALLATSAQAHGLFADNPWSLGIMGGLATPTAAELIGKADLILAFGATLNMWSTAHGRLINPAAKIIQVDHRAGALGARHRVDLALLGDAKETALALIEEVEAARLQPPPQRTAALKKQIAAGPWSRVPYTDAGDENYIDPRTFSIALNELLPADRVVALDSGHFLGWPAQYWDVPDAQGFVFAQDFQSVGLGLASAIGAALAQPHRLTVAALGDGGALMAAAELETVTRLGLNMLIVVYNDAAYGAEVHHFGPAGHPLDLVRFPDFDFAALGEGAGMAGVTVRLREDLQPVAEWLAAGARGAMLVDAKITPTVAAKWLEQAFRGH